MVARAGEAIVFPQDVSQGYRTRATMKALPTAPHHPIDSNSFIYRVVFQANLPPFESFERFSRGEKRRKMKQAFNSRAFGGWFSCHSWQRDAICPPLLPFLPP